MIDRIFSAALTFCLLAAGTLAIGSEFIGVNHSAAATAQIQVVQLPTVEITGRRIQADTAVAQSERTEPVVAIVE